MIIEMARAVADRFMLSSFLPRSSEVVTERLGLVAGNIGEDDLASWIRAHLTPR